MFLLRTAFWLSVVILLLPAPKEQDNGLTNVMLEQRKALSTSDLVIAAYGAVDDLTRICERDPQVCETGAAIADTFKRKARYGASLLLDLFSDGDAPAGAQRATGGTLQPDDREPTWLSPVKSEQRV